MRCAFYLHHAFALPSISSLDDVVAAFDLAGDRSRSVKVQIAF